MEIIETSVFTRQVANLLSDDEYRLLQTALIQNPELGSIIPGGGGIRKVRWGIGGRGKRGGTRVIYFWAVQNGIIFMLTIYSKSEQDNLTPNQLRLLKRYVEQEFL